jgi:hypothetical protein
MNAVVVDFAKNRIKQLESEIADLKNIIIEFGGKNERHTKSINPVFIQAAQEEDRGFEIHRSFPGFCSNVFLGFTSDYLGNR